MASWQGISYYVPSIDWGTYSRSVVEQTDTKCAAQPLHSRLNFTLVIDIITRLWHCFSNQYKSRLCSVYAEVVGSLVVPSLGLNNLWTLQTSLCPCLSLLHCGTWLASLREPLRGRCRKCSRRTSCFLHKVWNMETRTGAKYLNRWCKLCFGKPMLNVCLCICSCHVHETTLSLHVVVSLHKLAVPWTMILQY